MNDFHVTELERALKEQLFGIVASHIDKEASTDQSAFASIKLLEQREIRVKLTDSGYETISEANVASDSTQSQVFETLDDLLMAVSPKYGERRVDELMARLSQLADTPS